MTSDTRRRDALTILLAFAALIFFLVRAQSPAVGSVSLIVYEWRRLGKVRETGGSAQAQQPGLAELRWDALRRLVHST